MRVGVGSPAARAEMRRMMEELGYLEEQDRVDEADRRPPAPEPAAPDQAAEEAGSDAEASDGEEAEERRQPGVTSTGAAGRLRMRVSPFLAGGSLQGTHHEWTGHTKWCSLDEALGTHSARPRKPLVVVLARQVAGAASKA